jgi:hypothetical protein
VLKSKATKSVRSAEAKSFILSAVEVLRNDYGCRVEVVGDASILESTSISTEYMHQALSVLATVARAGKSAKIRFVIDEGQIRIIASVPSAVYGEIFKSSYVAESTADLGGFKYSVEYDGDDTLAVLTIIPSKHRAIALYAISKAEIKALIRSILNV